MKRRKEKGLLINTNIERILESIDMHTFSAQLQIIKPNQTDTRYITYDISCNEDFALHSKYYDWKKIFGFFRDHPVAKATLATKYIPINFLEFNPNKKVRIRFSLMPQRLSTVLEPNTTKILDRIKAVDGFIDAGYEVHLNFSPVILYKEWLEDYTELFNIINDYVDNKDEVFSEVIFLTHGEDKHLQNLRNGLGGEHLLWVPKLQEEKITKKKTKRIRYKRKLKYDMIVQFKKLHKEIIPWNYIRYIF